MKEAEELAERHRAELAAARESGKLDMRVHDRIRAEFLAAQESLSKFEQSMFTDCYYRIRDGEKAQKRGEPTLKAVIPSPVPFLAKQGSKIELLAGKLGSGRGFLYGVDAIAGPVGAIKFKDMSRVEIATEREVKRLSGTVGWGVVGGAALGPLGLLAGVLLGGKGKEVTFIIRLRDDSALLARASAQTYELILASVFTKSAEA